MGKNDRDEDLVQRPPCNVLKVLHVSIKWPQTLKTITQTKTKRGNLEPEFGLTGSDDFNPGPFSFYSTESEELE